MSLQNIHTFVFADRLDANLKPLTDNTCTALLSLVGKPILFHTLETLSEADLKRTTLIISSHAERIKQEVEEGKRWGLQIDYVLSQGNESMDSVLPRLPHAENDTLLVRGDVIHSRIFAEFLQQIGDKQDIAYASIQNTNVACFCRGSVSLEALQKLGRPAEKNAQTLDFPNARYSALENLQAFHQTSLDIAAQRFPDVSMAGREIALGLVAGLRARVSPKSLKQGCAYVGEESRIHHSSDLSEDVAIAPRVIVDKEAIVRDSVIMPDTYIGELVEVSHAIVMGNQLIRVDTGTSTQVTDSFLLADLQSMRLDSTVADVLSRMLGFGLLLLSLPLWLVAWLNSGNIAEKRTLQGNRLEINEFGMRQRCVFETWEYPLQAPVLRHLPKILAVVSGELRLVGVLPLTPEQALNRQEDWEKTRDTAPSGLIGPTQLMIERDAPLEEKLLCDAFYAQQRSTRKDLEYVWLGVKKLFSKSAWQ